MSQPEVKADGPCPWERPGAARRDCEPHRGNWLQLFAGIGLAFGLLSFIFLPLVVVSGAVATTTLLLAKRDREKMEAGLMDPDGRRQVEQAQALASWAVAADLVAIMLCGMVWLAVLLQHF